MLASQLSAGPLSGHESVGGWRMRFWRVSETGPKVLVWAGLS